MTEDGQRWQKEIHLAIQPPESYELYQNYPNPFNPGTTISYQLSRDARVALRIFNLLGQEIATLTDGHQIAGFYQMTWNGSGVSSGMYVYELSITEGTQKKHLLRKTMVLLK
jgi:hypothetical protein